MYSTLSINNSYVIALLEITSCKEVTCGIIDTMAVFCQKTLLSGTYYIAATGKPVQYKVGEGSTDHVS